MSFLTPLYALAGLAIIAPIIAHLVRKRPKDKIEFSSSLFLERDTPRLTKSSQVDQWWLLILRTLLVLLVAAAFARPYWNSPVSTDSARSGVKRLIMIDVSASMRRAGLLERAKEKSSEWISSANPEDVVAVYSFHRDLVPAFSLETSLDAGPEQRQSLAKQAVAGLEATWLDTNVGASVRTAVELLSAEEESPDKSETTIPASLELVIVSDFQQGGQYEELALIEWPKGLVVRQISVGLSDDPTNAFAKVIRLNAADSKDVVDDSVAEQNQQGTSADDKAIVRVSNSPNSRAESFKVGWVDTQGKIIESTIAEALVPPGQSRNIFVTAMPKDAVALRLTGDNVDFDNEFFCSTESKLTKTIYCFTNRSDIDEKSAAFFLQQLPLSGNSYNVDLRILRSSEAWELDPKLNPCTFLIGLPEDSSLNKLKRYLDDGGAIFWLIDQSVSETQDLWQAALRALSNQMIISVSEGLITDFRLLQNINFSDYLFNEFADAKFSDFTKIRFWKQRDLTLETSSSAEMLAEFDHGKPALVRLRIGNGELTVLAAGWQPEESQLALSSKFLPLILRYVASSFPASRTRESILVGSKIDLMGSAQVSLPDGNNVNLVAGKEQTLIASTPGNYSITSVEGTTRVLSVNLDSKESQIAPLDATRLLQWGVPLEERKIANPTEGMLRQMRAVELEAQQGTWRWLLVIVIVAAALESIFAWQKSYQRTTAA